MIKIGVIGLGTMGTTHLDAYSKRSDVEVIAISDIDPAKLEGKARVQGNIEGQAKGGSDLSKARKYNEGMKLIRDKDVQLVDVCLTTPLHTKYAKAALKAGKHVLVEKPLSRTGRDAAKLADFAETCSSFAMPAMCMRFWPGWTWLKRAVDQKTYGKVLSATFRRVGSHPGGPFYSNGELSGGGILDLHIHDTDFVQHLFGIPASVSSRGYTTVTGQIDHVVTHYEIPGVPLVVAEGGWTMAPGYGFRMQYVVNFETATAEFSFGDKPLTLFRPGQPPEAVQLEPGMGYDGEIAYLIECIKTNTRPSRVTLRDGANAVKIVEAEAKSCATGKPVKIKI